MERRIEDLLLQGRYKAGDRIPPEAELVGSLGVSRVTVRAGLARGWSSAGCWSAAAGAGRFAGTAEGARLQARLERLETYTVHAERLGLKLDSEDLDVEDVGAGPEEAAAPRSPRGPR